MRNTSWLLASWLLLAACNAPSATAPLPPVLAAASLSPTAAAAAAVLPQSIAEAVADRERSADFLKRDVYRHPQATLDFFEVTPDSVVVEIYPSGGWYTEILAPLLKTHGRYYAAMPWVPANADHRQVEGAARFQAKLKRDAARFDAVQVTALAPPDHIEIAPAGTADRVLTFRNVHNWLANGNAEGMFAAFFTALKPGGLLGVEEHRAKSGTPMAQMKTLGYVTEDTVIALARKAGFKLVARSEINANPKDTKDYEKGVWTLPPSLALGEKDKAKYLAIGESDRMTLKFIKPLEMQHQ